MWASSRPETGLFRNFVVRRRVCLCGVQEYTSAQPLAFLERIEKYLVSASGTTQPSQGLPGWKRARAFSRRMLVRISSVWIVFWLVGFAGVGMAGAGEASLEIRVPDHAVTIGDRVSVRVQARGGEDGLWGDLDLTQVQGDSWELVEGPREIPGTTPPSWEIVLVPMALGELELPAIEASLRNSEGEAVNIGADPVPKITVGSVLAPEDEGAPAPLRSPVGIKGFPWEWVVPACVLLLPFLVLVAWWWRSRSKGRLEADVPRLEPFDELEKLLAEFRGAIGHQPAAVVCDRLARGVRRYLERRTGEPAIEMTSHELGILARAGGWPQEVQAGLQNITGVVDGVRFGRRPVADAELETAGRSAHDVGRHLEEFLRPETDGDEGEQ